MRFHVIPLLSNTIDTQQRRGLSEAIDLDELPSKFTLYFFNRGGRRRGTCHHNADATSTGNWPVPSRRCIKNHADHRRGSTEKRDPIVLYASKNLCAVDLPQDDVLASHSRDAIGHAPPIAVELGQRVEIDVTIINPRVEREQRGIQPKISVG